MISSTSRLEPWWSRFLIGLVVGAAAWGADQVLVSFGLLATLDVVAPLSLTLGATLGLPSVVAFASGHLLVLFVSAGPSIEAVGLAIAVGLPGLVGQAILRRRRFDRDRVELASYGGFAVSIVASSALTALVGSLVLFGGDFGASFGFWAASQLTSHLIFSPALLFTAFSLTPRPVGSLGPANTPPPDGPPPWELAAIALLLLVMTGLVWLADAPLDFGSPFVLLYLAPLLWACHRYGLRGGLLAVSVVGLSFLIGASLSRSVPAASDAAHRLTLDHLATLGIFSVLTAFAGSYVQERRSKLELLAAANRLRHELAEVAAKLARADGPELESTIEDAFVRVAEFVPFDRIAIWTASQDGSVSRDYIWMRGTEPMPPSLFTSDDLGYMLRRAFAGEVFGFSNLDEIPEEAAEDRATMEALGVTSNVTIPLQIRGGVAGAITAVGVGRELTWSEDSIDSLSLLGEIIANALNRAKADVSLRDRERQLRALSARLESVREEQSTRISRELHDELGQALTALKFDLAWIRSRIDGSATSTLADELIEKTETMSTFVDETLGAVRRIATDLRPRVLDSSGLIDALSWQASEFERRTEIRCKVETDPDEVDLDDERSTALFRIYQEILTNVARHSGAQRVSTVLRRLDEELELVVSDDGCGIDLDREPSGSLGIIGMRERARGLGGEVWFAGAPERGTTVTVRIPFS